MKKLRKMLGNVNSQECLVMMSQIETQSKMTLSSWAISYVKENYLPIYESKEGANARLRTIIEACKTYFIGEMKLNEVKMFLKEATEIARNTMENPIAQAAARAIATACSTLQTPTSALGFIFYGAACIAYERVGLEEESTVYEQFASDEFSKALVSLQAVSILDEKNPVKIKWNC